MTTINNPNLRNQLLKWTQLTKAALDCPNPSSERTNAIFAFVRTFVPPDVTEDDIDHFANNLVSDEVSCFLIITTMLVDISTLGVFRVFAQRVVTV